MRNSECVKIKDTLAHILYLLFTIAGALRCL